MPERYNFITECFDDKGKGIEAISELQEFSNHIVLNEFARYGGNISFFISGQSIEEDSNAGPWQLRNCLQTHGIVAVFINDPSEYGIILKR